MSSQDILSNRTTLKTYIEIVRYSWQDKFRKSIKYCISGSPMIVFAIYGIDKNKAAWLCCIVRW